MELNKVMEGFTVSNNLVIKAQVQVIRCARPPVRVSPSMLTATACPALAAASAILLDASFVTKPMTVLA